MSRETWLLMVQVAKQKIDAAKQGAVPRKRRKKTTITRLFGTCVREDHYALLLAAGY